MAVSQAFKDRFDDDIISFQIKFYIEDSAAVGSKEWVDFSDSLEYIDVNPTGERERINITKGVNKYLKVGNISHKTEVVVAGNTFITSIQSVTVDNNDGFWDNPDQWGDLQNIRGEAATFELSQLGQEIVLDKLRCKFTIELVHADDSIEEGTLGVFRIKNVKTNNNTGKAELIIADQSFFLKKLDAAEVKNGRSWYEQRPVKFLIQELLKQEPLFIDSDGELLTNFNFPDVVRIPTSDTTRVLSSYGRPPEFDGSRWNDGLGLFCRALVWGAVNMSDASLSVHDGNNRLFLGLDNELWLWNPATDEYTKLATLVSGSQKIRHLFIVGETIYGASMEDPNGSEWRSFGTFFKLSPAGTAFERFSGGSQETNVNMYNSQMNYRRGRLAQETGFTPLTQEPDIFPMLGAANNQTGAGENLLLPFSQKLKSLAIDGVALELQAGIFTSNSPSTIDVDDIDASENFNDIIKAKSPSEIKPSGYYRVMLNAAEKEITAMSFGNFLNGTNATIKIKTNTGLTLGTLNAGNPGTFVPGTVLTSAEAIFVEFDPDGSTFPFNSLNFTGIVMGAKTYNNKNISIAVVIKNLFPDSDNSFYLNNNYTLRANSGDSGVTDFPIDLQFSLGHNTQYVYNSSENALIYFNAVDKGNESSELLNVPVSLRGKTLTDVILGKPDGSGGSFIIETESFRGVGEGEGTGGRWLQPTAIATHPTKSEIYIGSIEWYDIDDGIQQLSSTTYLHKVTLDVVANDLGTTFATSTSSGTSIPVNSGTGFDVGDIILVVQSAGSSVYTTVVAVFSTNLRVSDSVTWFNNNNIYIVGKCLHRKTSHDTIMNMKHMIGKDLLVISTMRRDRLGQSNMYTIGLKDTTARDNTEILDVDNNSGFSPTPIRDIVQDVVDTTSFYYYTADGRLYKFKHNGGTIGVTTLLSDGFQAVDEDPNLSSNLVSISEVDMDAIDGETRVLNNSLVMGVSAPVFLNETQPANISGKYYLWKFDEFMTDRIPLADFEGMKVWDAIGKLAQVPDYLVGFDLDEKGSFFLTKKNNDSNASVLHTFESSAIKSNLISVIKERNSDDVYNYVIAIPYVTRIGNITFEFRFVPRTNKSEEDTLLNKDDILLSSNDSIRKSLKLICVKDGDVASTDLQSNSLFKWIEFDREIEARLTSPFTANGANVTLTLGSLFRGGNSGPSADGLDSDSEPLLITGGINIGDFVTLVDPSNNQSSIRRVISLTDPVTGFPTLTIDSAWSFTNNPIFPRGTILKIQKGFTSDTNATRKDWSDDGVTFVVANGLNTDLKFQVDSVKDLSVDTVIAIDERRTVRILKVKTFDIDFGGPTVEVAGSMLQAPSANDVIRAYYSPYDTGSSAFVFQEIGGSNLFIKIAPTKSINSQLRTGDILTLNTQGLLLEAEEHSTIIASDINTVSGRQQKTFDNKFMHRRLLQQKVFRILAEYKDPRYRITVEGGIIPYAQFIDNNGLVRFKVVDKKLFRNKHQNAVIGYPREITHNLTGMTTTIIIRDEKSY